MQGQVLKQREELILHAVVHSFVTTADPVGSRTVVRRFGLDISPATVRNVMADLEEAGYLQQRHTSSGRVPTDKGYRYYVDYLMRVQEITQADRKRVEHDLEEKRNDADAILQETSYLLALISHQTGIVEAPNISTAEVRRIETMPIGGSRVAVLVADSYGRVRTSVVSFEDPLTVSESQQLNRFLNDRLQGVSSAIERVRLDRVEEQVGQLHDDLVSLLDQLGRMERSVRQDLGRLAAPAPPVTRVQ